MGKATNPRPLLNKRRGPVTRTRQPEQNRVVAARPNNSFAAWWAWALEQADAARNDPPVRIHDEDRPVDNARHQRGIIVGWPFSAQFERFTAGKRNEGPMALTLRALKNPRGNHPHEFRILWALLNGHDDPEIIRALIGGCREDFFRAAAIRAFELVHERIEETLGGVA